MQLHLVFHLNKSDLSGYTATMDSPDQGVKNIHVDEVIWENSLLTLKVKNANITYEGLLENDNIFKGSFKQSGYSFPMDLSREAIKKQSILRPQDPLEPYPYSTEEVIYENKKAGIKLSGTLSLPNQGNKFPAVILISGSGPQNRDSEIFGHRPFLVISDFLTRSGIAVLRYDDRGTAASTGDFSSATSLDFVSDVEAGIQFLKSRKEIIQSKIGLIGHSEGGLIAPLVTSNLKDVAFIVLLAGPGLRGDQILLLQQELISRASGTDENEIMASNNENKTTFDIITNTLDLTTLKAKLHQHITSTIDKNPNQNFPSGMTKDEFITTQVAQLTSPWMLYFIRHDPRPILEKIKCPVLDLNGQMDLQVPSKENLHAIENALRKAKNRKVTIKELPKLNHLFQESTTGSPAEYAAIEQTFSPVALDEMLIGIKSIVK